MMRTWSLNSLPCILVSLQSCTVVILFHQNTLVTETLTVGSLRVRCTELRTLSLSNPKTTTKGGRHTRDLDKALPGMHTKILYYSLTWSKSTILAQMRAGNSRLKSYPHDVEAEDSHLCGCGQKETVKHVLLDRSIWQAKRKDLRTKVDGATCLFFCEDSQGEKISGKVY